MFQTMAVSDVARRVWAIPERLRAGTTPRDAVYRPHLLGVYEVAQFWIALGGIVVGVGIALVLELPVGWWIAALCVPELAYVIRALRRGRHSVMVGMLIHSADVGAIGLLLVLPAFSGAGLMFIVVAAMLLLPVRGALVVAGTQALYAAAAVVVHLADGHPGWTESEEVILSALAILFFTSASLVLLWAVMRELDVLDRLRARLLRTVSHELRSPLTGVIGLGEVLQGEWRDMESDTVDELLDIITREGTEAAAIVEDLLTVVRSSAGQLDLRIESVPVVGQVQSVVAVHGSVSGRTVEVLGDETLEADADAGRLRQIVRNLLTNAERYGGELVRVRVDREGGQVSIVVADNGQGIDPGEWEVVFQSFGRATGVARHPESIGLGLPISRTLARRMGGDLTYHHDGEWSRFTLVLPAAGASTVGQPVS